MSVSSTRPRRREDIGDFEAASRVRHERVRAKTMSDRLALVHEISLQMSQVRGAARER